MTIRQSLIIFLALCFFAAWYTKSTPPRGDELHYLVTAHSLAYDHDLYLENNYQNGDYKKFFPGEIDRHSVIGRGGHEYLYHGLGAFPILITPFYILGRRLGVVIFLVFLYVLLLREIYKQTRSKFIFIFAFTLPLLSFSVLIFPEIIAGLFFFRIIRQLKKPTWIEFALIGLLPWIHLRFLPPSAFLLVIMAFLNRKRNLRIILFPIAEIILYFCFHFLIYESFSLTAPYTKLGIQTGGANIIQNVIMAFTDAQYGLFFVSPISIFAIAGSLILGLKNKLHLVPFIILAIYSLFVFRYYDWHGGYAPPARYLATFLPLFIPGSVLFLQKGKFWQKFIFLLLSIWSVLVSITTLFSQSFGFVFLDGQVPSLNTFSLFLGINIRDLFPAFYPSKEFSLLHAIWFFIAAIFCAILIGTYVKKDSHKN